MTELVHLLLFGIASTCFVILLVFGIDLLAQAMGIGE